jgi:ATP-dependent exoDNAse (exonuclease V) alpha subunit
MLTQGQKKSLEAIHFASTWQGKVKVVIIRGYAGTGKTTLLKMLSKIGMESPTVVAPTGKAALRVEEATDLVAQTIHRFIYNHKPDNRTGEFTRTNKDPAEIEKSGCGCIFVDEASMVDLELWEDLFAAAEATQQNLVCLGDPFQLPPVSSAKEHFSIMADEFLCTKRVDMTEIVRQALDNPIIRASMMVREGDVTGCMMELPHVAASRLIERSHEVYDAKGAVICHRNNTRNSINRAIRKRIGHPENSVVEGEPLLICKNNYDAELYNGEVVRFNKWVSDPELMMFKDKFNDNKAYSVYVGKADVEGAIIEPYLCVEEVMGLTDPSASNSIQYFAGKRFEKGKFVGANLGYTLTCHKSQGSEWPEVLVALEPTVSLTNKEGQRWLYTALTRAKEKVSVCVTGWEV